MPYKFAVIGAGSAAAYYCAARLESDLTEGVREQLASNVRFIKASSFQPKVGDRRDRTQEQNREDYLKHLKTQEADLRDTVLIGGAGPWAPGTQIGRGPKYVIGHTAQTVGMRPLSEYPNEDLQKYTPREAFNDESNTVIGEAMARGMTHEYASVTRLRYDSGSKLFKVAITRLTGAKDSTVIEAENVLLLTGGGDYIEPTEENAIKVPMDWKRVGGIMNLDQFMRHLAAHGETTKGKSVCIQGANAAIDGVEQAHAFEYTVQWLVRSSPTMLPESQLEHTPKFIAAKGGEYVNVGRTSKLRAGVQSVKVEEAAHGKLKVTVYSDDKWTRQLGDAFEVDYYVYCIGQDANLGPQGAIYMLTQGDTPLIPLQKVKKNPRGVSSLEDDVFVPIYDEGFYFREFSKRPGTVEEAAIGLRRYYEGDKSRRLDILGAASFMVLDSRGGLMNKLRHTIYYQVASVFDVRQLGAMRDVMRAYCNALSGVSLDKKNVNFIGGTKDELAAYIAMHHDFIPPVIADDLVDFLALVRTRVEYTNGYSRTQITEIQRALEAVDRYFETNVEVRQALSNPSVSKGVEAARAGLLDAFNASRGNRAPLDWSAAMKRSEFLQ